jgi:FkbM family methyltransferase
MNEQAGDRRDWKDAIINVKKWIGRLQAQRDDLLDWLDRRQTKAGAVDLTVPKVACGHGDGRWYVHPANLGPESVVYSVGIGYDISFDLDVIRRFGCRVHAFDPTILSRQWLRRRKLPADFCFHDLGLAHYDGEAVFRLPPGHSVSFTMNPVSGSSGEHQAQVRTLTSFMRQLGHTHIDVLKIDIEGAEFDVIDDLVASAPRIHQLLIEFHDRLTQEGRPLRTEHSIATLRATGFKLFHRSRRGFDYSFLR